MLYGYAVSFSGGTVPLSIFVAAPHKVRKTHAHEIAGLKMDIIRKFRQLQLRRGDHGYLKTLMSYFEPRLRYERDVDNQKVCESFL